MRIANYGLALLGLASSHGLAAAQNDPDDAAATVADDNVVPGAYIVELSEGADAGALYDELRAEGLAVAHRVDLNYRLFKGASFRLTNSSSNAADTNFADPELESELRAKISDKARVKQVWPVRGLRFPKIEPSSVGPKNRPATGGARRREHQKRQGDDGSDGDDYSPHVMAQVDRLRAEGLTGEGLRIGIVDTGIDYKHPALGGCFGKGCLVGYGWDLTGDEWSGGAEGPTPDPDPYDNCQGHGTHVAGIVAAQENELGFTGVAPGVTIGAYKVSGCPGYTTNEILLSAFNLAYEDGSDVISCSAGDDSGWASDAWGVAASRIAEAGVPVVVALGNSGNIGVWTAATPASGREVAGIGSAHNTVLPTIVTAGLWSDDDKAKSGFGYTEGNPSIAQTNLTLPLWVASYNTTVEDDACEPLADDTPDLSEKITLLRQTEACTSDKQGENVAAKGGRYIMFYTRKEDQIPAAHVSAEGIIGVGTVSPKQGAAWIEALSSGANITLTIESADTAGLFVENLSNGVAAGLTSPFTSWGPTWEVEVKPQFVAPGGWILSTFPLDQGSYAVNPGTSMSCPFAAAVFALVGQKRGSLDAQVLRRILSATSKPSPWVDEERVYNDILAPVAQQGAGLLQAYDAALATVIPSVSSISFNDSDNFVGEHSFNLENTGSEDVTFALGHAKAATVYSFGEDTRSSARFPPPVVDDWATIVFESDSITVPAGGSANVTFTAEPPSGSGLNATRLPVYSGYITLNSTNGGSLSIPYLGVAGSLHDTQVLRPWYAENGNIGGVYLTSTESHFNIAVPANTTFTIPRPGEPVTNEILPKMMVVPSVGSRELRLDVVTVEGKNLGLMPSFPQTYIPRIGRSYIFGGRLADGTVVEPGSYKFVVSALKIFGDADTKEDWDIVESVPFNLKYI